HGRALEPDVFVLAHRGQPAAEVEPLRAGGRGEQLVERRRPRLCKSQEIALGTGVELAQAREDLLADETPLRIGVRLVRPELEPVLPAVRLRLVAPRLE